MKHVIVGMSGGLDSSVSAYLLKNRGFAVTGLTLRLWSDDSSPDSVRVNEMNVNAAKSICSKLDIEHRVLDLSHAFEGCVIDYFTESYLAGITPNPCAVCNREIKFGRMAEYCRKEGYDYLATGHYARLCDEDTEVGPFICEGEDKSKDQSYFLFNVKRSALPLLIFPLQNTTRDSVLAIAGELGIVKDSRPTSRDACFLIEDNYRDFMKARFPDAFKSGPIRDSSGRILGRHRGYALYTVGQRRGLGVSHSVPLYVISIDRKSNTLVVGSREDTLSSEFMVRDINWHIDRPSGNFKCHVKIRYTHRKASAEVVMMGENAAVTFDTPQQAVTPGQGAAFYDGQRLLGGGWIERVTG